MSLTFNKTWDNITLLAHLEFALTLGDFIIIVYLYKNILRRIPLSMFRIEKQGMSYVNAEIQAKLEMLSTKI